MGNAAIANALEIDHDGGGVSFRADHEALSDEPLPSTGDSWMDMRRDDVIRKMAQVTKLEKLMPEENAAALIDRHWHTAYFTADLWQDGSHSGNLTLTKPFSAPQPIVSFDDLSLGTRRAVQTRLDMIQAGLVNGSPYGPDGLPSLVPTLLAHLKENISKKGQSDLELFVCT
jgi:hypothetical protein